MEVPHFLSRLPGERVSGSVQGREGSIQGSLVAFEQNEISAFWEVKQIPLPLRLTGENRLGGEKRLMKDCTAKNRWGGN